MVAVSVAVVAAAVNADLVLKKSPIKIGIILRAVDCYDANVVAAAAAVDDSGVHDDDVDLRKLRCDYYYWTLITVASYCHHVLVISVWAQSLKILLVNGDGDDYYFDLFFAPMKMFVAKKARHEHRQELR